MGRRVDKVALGEFLRPRRAALQREDVGLRRGSRRRVLGLRREELADLCDMSVDYVARLERGDGPQPSDQMLAAVARGLRLTPDERDHLFAMAGHRSPARLAAEHISPGLMRVVDRLQDTPAQVMGPLGETLLQTAPAVAVLGPQTGHSRMRRSAAYRWFTDPTERDRYLPDDHELTGRVNVALLRTAAARDGVPSAAASLVAELRAESSEFDRLWQRHEVGLRYSGTKRFAHPDIGRLDLFCQSQLDVETGQSLLVFTATPGTTSHDKLALLAVLGTDRSPPEPNA